MKHSEIVVLFPSKCCNEAVTDQGFCSKCHNSVLGGLERKIDPAYEEMWRKAFKDWDRIIDELFARK